MENECGECFWFSEGGNRCKLFNNQYIFGDRQACNNFVPKPEAPKPTNGDVIRQGGNRALAEIFDDIYNGNKCKYCIHHAGSGVCKLNPTPYSEYDEGYLDDEDCLNGFEAWLNAPAESQLNDAIQNVIKDGAKTAIDIHEAAYAPDMNVATKESEGER